ncbi:porin family protein [Pontibacter korlensis]|nr:porin family protein [Pontibacter korlensis]
MKNKILLTVAAALGLAFAAEAQTVSIGPRVGATFAKLNLSGDDEFTDEVKDLIQSKPGLQFGAVANVMVNDLFSVQPELLYVQKGYQIEEGGVSAKETMNYLEVPVLAKISFGSGQVQGFVTAGPSVGYWLSAKNKYEYDGEEETEDYEFEDEDNRTEFGANFGVGLAYKVGAGALNLDVRYGLGLSNLYDDSGDDSKVKNRVVGVSLAYLFSL